MAEGYKLSFAMDGGKGLQQIKDDKYDLIMINSEVPELSALDIMVELQLISHNCDTPVIFLLNEVTTKGIEDLYDAGAVDYISLPFVAQEVITRVKTHLSAQVLVDQKELKAIDSSVHEQIDNKLSDRFEEIFEEHRQRGVSQQDIIFTLCSLMEKRSHEKTVHVRRIADVSYLLALLLGFNDDEASLLKMAAPLHDVGNLAVPDRVLSKPDELTMEEFEMVEKHTQFGFDMLKSSQEPILKLAAIISQQHHEKYNGSGYPQGLRADEIHIFARIVALADVFDTLSEDRVYGKAWDDNEIERYIEKERGNHFDPTLVDIFLRHKDRFFELRSKQKLF
jgi:putative two-component system response regulator